MSADPDALDVLAEVLATASDALRKHAQSLRSTIREATEHVDVVAVARRLHGSLGPRQAEVLALLQEAGPVGTNTGVLSRRMGYTQPNVHLTLKELVRRGLVEKDASARPHNYRLSPRLGQ
jgi:DNA-binding MarR family transcriptional regulator